MPKKERIPVPLQTAALVLYRADRTCCVCRDPRKTVQIHHLDEDPTNNEVDNLAALCLDCHNKTQLTGGFGRKLDAAQIVLYRDGWLEQVETSRIDVASVVASTQLAGGGAEGAATNENLADALAAVASLLPDWLDAVETDPVLAAQFKATWDAYDQKLKRFQPGGARFALEQRQASELLDTSKRHLSLLRLYIERTEAMDRLIFICLDTLDDHPDVWPLLAELDGAVRVAADIITEDAARAPGVHIYDWARQRVHQGGAVVSLFEVWREVRRITRPANAIVMGWNERLAPYRTPTGEPTPEAS